MEIATLGLLQKHDPWRCYQHDPEPRLHFRAVLLRPLPIGDVFTGNQHDKSPTIVLYEPDSFPDPEDGPILTHFAELPGSQIGWIRQTSVEGNTRCGPIFLMEYRQHGPADQFLGQKTERFSTQPVDGKDGSIRAHGEIHEGAVLIKRAIPVLAFT